MKKSSVSRAIIASARVRAIPALLCRKFFFLFTCEFCFSHYVAALFLVLTHYKLLFNDWRGYLIALFALVWIANQYMSVYAHLRLDIRKDRAEIKHVEKKVEEMEERNAAYFSLIPSAAREPYQLEGLLRAT